MKTVIFTRPVLRLLAVAGFMLAGAGVVWLFSGMPAPREIDRITPADKSFSIIKPREWDARVIYGSDGSRYVATIEITPVKSVGLMQRFSASRFREPPDAEKLREGFTPYQFQGRAAWLSSKQIKKDYMFHLIFDRDGQWYEISLRLPTQTDVPGSDWWKYVNTFQAAPGSGTLPVQATTNPVIGVTDAEPH
jgi:hypothetical protein